MAEGLAMVVILNKWLLADRAAPFLRQGDRAHFASPDCEPNPSARPQ